MKAHVGPVAVSFTDNQLIRLIEHVGDLPLACDCLTQIPQPSWLRGVMGAL